MPIAYTCDQCQQTATSLVGWHVIDFAFNSMVEIPASGTRGQEAAPVTYYFHELPCRDAWLTAKGLGIPEPLP